MNRKSITPLFSLLVALMLFTECKNVLVENDGIGDGPPIKFENQQFAIGQGEVILLRIDDWTELTGDATVQVENQAEFLDRLIFTSDGFLAYWAPYANLTEEIRLELKDEAGNMGLGIIEMKVNENNMLEECSDDFEIVVGSNASKTPILNISGDDKLCIGFPYPGLELIIPPKELQMEVADGNVFVQPQPGGIGVDYFVYKNTTSTPNSEYLEVVKIFNETGCHERGVADNITITFDALVATYDIRVFDNDEFCTFNREDASIEEVLDVSFGTAEIINNQSIAYTIDGTPSLPLVESFTYVASYQTKFGKVTYGTDVQLTINP